MKKPNLFQVGQPKSGTSALHGFLDQHPAIFMSKRKEPLYFCDDLRQEAEDACRDNLYKFDIRTEGDYLSLFSGVTDEAIVGESTTHYLYSKVAAERIRQFHPGAKILIILRNPVDFLCSYHSQCLVQSVETEVNLEKALRLEEERHLGRHVPRNAFCPSFLFYAERIKYYEQVKRYLDRFDRAQIKIIAFEDFREDNLGMFKGILEFLGVDSMFVPHVSQVNPNAEPRSFLMNRLVFSPRLRTLAQRVLPGGLLANASVKDTVKRLVWKETERSSIGPELRHELMDRSRSEVEKLSDALGVNFLVKWGYDGA